jgi:hypothetical protein
VPSHRSTAATWSSRSGNPGATGKTAGENPTARQDTACGKPCSALWQRSERSGSPPLRFPNPEGDRVFEDSAFLASSAFSFTAERAAMLTFAQRLVAARRPRRSSTTQRPRVPAPTPSSRATCATGLPVSRTIRTAPSLNSDQIPPCLQCPHPIRDASDVPHRYLAGSASRDAMRVGATTSGAPVDETSVRQRS